MCRRASGRAVCEANVSGIRPLSEHSHLESRTFGFSCKSLPFTFHTLLLLTCVQTSISVIIYITIIQLQKTRPSESK